MSNLKHMSQDELRKEISSIAGRRSDLIFQAEALEAQAAEILRSAATKRRTSHNHGQREAWARIYLARKGLEPITPAHRS
jgi:hypothetical protein